MAEVIKHSVIQPSTPFAGGSLAERLASTPLAPIADEVVEDILTLNIAIKQSVVEADERESGLRMILNFGHTAGHAIEASGYRYRHGEAVALGMCVAVRVARYLDRTDDAHIRNIESTLRRAGLPVRFDGSVADVMTRLSRDKKNVDGSLHWVLPRGSSGVDIVTGVPESVVEQALRDVHVSSAAAGEGNTVL
jgi:3-dehydroquinate synthetase